MALKVLSALDLARTQFYHFKAIIITGMGLFTDAYDLFSIPLVMRFIGRIFYEKRAQPDKYVTPPMVVSIMAAIALVGTVIGQAVFGRLGDLVGRRRVYGIALMIMVLSSIGCGFSVCTTRSCVLVSLGLFRFILGFGVGGDYPLSATIMSEYANKRTRGCFIAAVFSMQGFGILVASVVTMVVCAIFNRAAKGAPKDPTPKEADIAWRLILMLGAIPAGLTFYWRMKMPETPRYTALVERNIIQAAMDMENVMEVPMSQIVEDELLPPSPLPYPLLSKQFFRLHGRDLFSCCFTWFLVDIVFYSSNFFQSRIYLEENGDKNVYQDVFEAAKLQAIIALCSTIPGYFFSVYFIDKVGRVKIQMMGFSLMALVFLVLGITYDNYRDVELNDLKNKTSFLVLYGLTFFFANFGPNTTTFIVPAGLFPARFRSTCHGISGAIGKVGAIIGSVGFVWASDGEKTRGMTVSLILIILAGVCLLGMAITFFFTHETMGRSLEENENDD
ncbi:probable inorganic phosphate transporter 1-9 [Quercus robur]|uniref:probable inorganic phosphate transporter 1-9 n=1 Tax=Quercus robur TaxID=38942 RepID=UPI002161C8A8|nr:probable inorganic phosphate transporter 1-9 [Quercus robur]